MVNQAQIRTDAQGEVIFSFVPERAGTYRVRSVGNDPAGRRTTAEVNVWVAGQEAGLWRQPAVGRMALVPDQDSYKPGETARILVPSPFDGPARALVTIERGRVLSHQVLEINSANAVVEVPLEAIHAPNVFVSVILIEPASRQRPPSIAVGLVELPVSADSLQLQLTLTPDSREAEPGQTLTYSLEAADSNGQPIQGEFSLALVDLAVLSLTEPNSPSPFESFYGRQPLRIQTGASLAISAEVGLRAPPFDGLGGGGGGFAPIEVRSEFPDTAYWNPSVVTDETGRARVTLELPDSLTTWRMDARGVTRDTLVGDILVDVVATKDLFVRPITPRFFTAGDVATVAAVVHNNLDRDLAVEVRLSAGGARILSTPTQTLSVAAKGQQRLEWQLAIQDVESVDLTFSAAGGGLQDASKPTVGTAKNGALPVLRFSAPDTASMAGELASTGQHVQLINLPRRFDATQGELSLQINLSLGAALDEALLDLEENPYASTEHIVSRFLPNVAVLRVFRTLESSEPRLAARLDESLGKSLLTLLHRQNADGGWGWWLNSPSDSYLTAYTLYGLGQARLGGVAVDDSMVENATQYLQAGVLPSNLLPNQSERDRQVFVLHALATVGAGDLPSTRQMAAERETLSIWGRSLLAQTLAQLAPDDAQIPALISDMESAAVRSATGAHWESAAPDLINLNSSVSATAHALRALLDLDPQNPLLPDGIRWLLSARSPQGAWTSTHESAWAMLALSDWLEYTKGLEADYIYSVKLNGQTLASGQATPDAPFTSVELRKPVGALLANQPNQLAIERGIGSGSLFYTAHLTVYRPVEQATATARGLSVEREYFHYDGQCGSGVEAPCQVAEAAQVGEELLVRVTLIVPSDQYYILVEDPYPAGMEPIDTSLKTSEGPPADFSTADPLRAGWGWWRFSRSELRDDRLLLFADFLPAGTYQYTYQVEVVHPGEYRVLPTRAWALYFPEVNGQAAGRIYAIEP